jgi:hypothetical protein
MASFGEAATSRHSEVGTVYACVKPFALAQYRNQVCISLGFCHRQVAAINFELARGLQLINHFAMEAILCCAIQNISSSKEDIFHKAQFLSTVFQTEFVFPAGNIEQVFASTLANLAVKISSQCLETCMAEFLSES